MKIELDISVDTADEIVRKVLLYYLELDGVDEHREHLKAVVNYFSDPEEQIE